MNVPRLVSDQGGFTIQELLIVLVVGSLLVSFTFALFLSSTKLLESWRTKTSLHDVVTRSLQRVAYDILQGRDISGISDTSLVVGRRTGTAVSYRFVGGRIQRNDDLLNGGNEIEMKLTISDVQPNLTRGRLLDLKITGRLREKEYTAETEVSPPASSREEFSQAKQR